MCNFKFEYAIVGTYTLLFILSLVYSDEINSCVPNFHYLSTNNLMWHFIVNTILIYVINLYLYN